MTLAQLLLTSYLLGIVLFLAGVVVDKCVEWWYA